MYEVQNALVTMLLGVFMWMLLLVLYIFPYVLLMITFVNIGRGIRIAWVMYCVMLIYDMITSRAMRVIWDMYLVLFACPGLGCYLWGFINNYTQPIGGTGEDYFSQPSMSFSSFRSATTVFENAEFPLDLKDSIILLLVLLCLLCMVYTMFRDRTRICREVVQRPAMGVDSHEWHGMWEYTG